MTEPKVFNEIDIFELLFIGSAALTSTHVVYRTREESHDDKVSPLFVQTVNMVDGKVIERTFNSDCTTLERKILDTHYDIDYTRRDGIAMASEFIHLAPSAYMNEDRTAYRLPIHPKHGQCIHYCDVALGE